MTDTFTRFHKQAQERVNSALEYALSHNEALGGIDTAMRYAVMNGGKRLRPTMTYAAFLATADSGSDNKAEADTALSSVPMRVDAASVALELIHSYSLVHDDLPAMDDDDLRRGKPSCHIAFSEATAILAGDGLQALAFEQLAACEDLTDSQHRRASLTLAQAAGPSGMVGGQMIDINAASLTGTTAKQVTKFTQVQLEGMHRAKTGALICAALEMGAICANATQQQCARLRRYGELVGLAFQVVDDVLDVIGDTEQLGKQQGSDQLLGKPTYPEMIGLESSQRYALELCTRAQTELSGMAGSTDILQQLATYIVRRVH